MLKIRQRHNHIIKMIEERICNDIDYELIHNEQMNILTTTDDEKNSDYLDDEKEF